MFDEISYPEVDPNKKNAQEIWQARYAGEKYLYGKEPSLVLKTFLDVLKKGKALDVAMGEGRNAVFLAEKGFEVEGLDCSQVAVEKAKKLAQEKNVKIEAKVQNLDFYLMPLMKFDTIVMSHFKPLPRFYSEIRRGLVERGTCVIEGYTVDHYKDHQKSDPNLDFDQCFKPNELLHALKDFRVIYYKEMKEGSAHIVQAIALKDRK